MEKITDDEIAKEAKLRYPYEESDNENRIHKLSSKRRRFIEGAKWMRDKIINQKSEIEFMNSMLTTKKY